MYNKCDDNEDEVWCRAGRDAKPRTVLNFNCGTIAYAMLSEHWAGVELQISKLSPQGV